MTWIFYIYDSSSTVNKSLHELYINKFNTLSKALQKFKVLQTQDSGSLLNVSISVKINCRKFINHCIVEYVGETCYKKCTNLVHYSNIFTLIVCKSVFFLFLPLSWPPNSLKTRSCYHLESFGICCSIFDLVTFRRLEVEFCRSHHIQKRYVLTYFILTPVKNLS